MDILSELSNISITSVIIQTVTSVALYENKKRLNDQSPSAWLLGILGLGVLLIPLIQEKMYVSVVATCGGIFLSLYGYAIAVKAIHRLPKQVEIPLRVAMLIVVLSICGYLLYATSSGNFKLLQFFHAITGLFGSLLLAIATQRSKKYGWALYIASHIFSFSYMFPKGYYIIALFQILSIRVAYDGYQKNKDAPMPLIE